MASIIDLKHPLSSNWLENDPTEPNHQLQFDSPAIAPEKIISSSPPFASAEVELIDQPKQAIELGKTDIPTVAVPLGSRLTETQNQNFEINNTQTSGSPDLVRISNQPSLVSTQPVVSLSPNLTALLTRFDGTLTAPNSSSSPASLPSTLGRCECSYCLPRSKTSSSQAEEAFGNKTAIADIRATGDNNIDGLLTTKRWKSFDVTYSYTDTYADYENNYGQNIPAPFSNYQNGYEQLSVEQIRAVVGWLEYDFANVSNLNPILLTGSKDRDATVRIAITAKANLNTARVAAFPEDNKVESGDVWFNADDYDTPVIGNFAYHTFGHELGHAMGLKHGHQTGGISNVAMNSDRDSMEFSVMTYRSHVGASTTGGYTNETWGYAQTLMMYDIRAIQQMYGADFSYNAANTTYTFSTTTGEMFIDGVGQGTPGGNRIFRTVWDGNGIDTYNFGNYTTNLRVDLSPGGWSDLAVGSNFQRAELNFISNIYARGHVFNALIYSDSNPNWIENAIGGAGNDVMIGNDANNFLNGVGGNDTLYGGFGNDTIEGGGGNDIIFLGAGNDLVNTYSLDSDFFYGEGGEDFIFGSLVNDYLNGGTGNDTLRGLSGDDTITGEAGFDSTFGDAGNDRIIDTDGIGNDIHDGGAGIDLIDYSILTGIFSINLISGIISGFVGADFLSETIANFENVEGGQGSEEIIGYLADNVLSGNGGNDVMYGNQGNDTLYGGAGEDRLFAHSGNNYLDGGSGNDTLNQAGSNGDDTLLGGEGDDSLIGGSGNDLYWVDSVSDVVVETSTLAAEIDTVFSAVGYTLGANIEKLYLLGSAQINGTGNNLNNWLDGNLGGNNILSGLAGIDTLQGGFGNDTLYGGEDNDLLLGSGGNDLLVGESGNDIYYVDGTGDRVQETSSISSEIDIVRASISYTLGANLERLELEGTANITATGNSLHNQLFGNVGSNLLKGLAGNDTILGTSGNDTLDGGTGNDTLVGGLGNNVYYVDSAGDVVRDSSFVISGTGTASAAAATGLDTVNSSASYSLGENLEQLVLSGTGNISGTGNSLNNLLIGNASSNKLAGQAGSDTLNGGSGADTLVGGSGNDFYIVDSVGDVVQETSTTGSEIDTVRTFISYSMGINLERLSLQGTSNINATGNNLSNFLVGNSGNNVLNGQGGNDTLLGNAGNDFLVGASGNDVLTGGSGNDRFHYVTGSAFATSQIGLDRITDFKRVAGDTDKILLSRTTFNAGTSFASVSSDALAAISAAYITFSKATGNLFYNQNGGAAGLGTGGQFATLSSINGAVVSSTNTLLATDFTIA